jgi:predicted acyltransferase
LLLMNKINAGGWVAINCIPTAAHTIWGVLAGKLLLSEKGGDEKVKRLMVAGLVGLLIGYSMNFLVTPIIKRIATSSFVLASGGWCLLALGLFYWWIDVKNHKKYLQFFTIVGMNSLFIYIFIEIIAGRWFNEYIGAISNGLMGIINVPLVPMGIITSLILFALEWNLCRFLYKKGIFFKI